MVKAEYQDINNIGPPIDVAICNKPEVYQGRSENIAHIPLVGAE